MPRTGRPKHDVAAHRKRGTFRPGRHATNGGPVLPSRKFTKPPAIRDIEGICRDGLPGYDPWSNPGPCEFDAGRARKAIRFFEGELTHCKGELSGTPFLLEPWQRAFIGNLFGWVRADGTRRYRRTLLYLARGNGKTTIAAGVLLYGLFEGDEYGAEIYGAACEYQQASLVFDHARGMVMFNPKLRDRCRVYAGQAKSIQLGAETGYSTYRVITSRDGAAHGFNVFMAAMDELHTQPDSRLLDAIVTGMGKRREPLLVCMTTADYKRQSVCNSEYEHACRVRDGILDDWSYLPAIFEVPRDADWKDKANWKLGNPNLGVSVMEDHLEQEFRHAMDSPAYENAFRRFHLNQITEQDVRWLPMTSWDACDGDVDPDALVGRPCYAGLDVAATTDMASLVLVFPEDGWAVLPFYWCPKDTIRERTRKDRVPYQTWLASGFIEATEGNVIDQAFIRQRILDLKDLYEIRKIAVDPWNSISLQIELHNDGFEIEKFRQGFGSMTGPSKDLEKRVLGGTLRHGGHPVLRWNASNVSIQIDPAGNIKPTKEKSPDKIDGIVALVMGLGLCLAAEQPDVSVYQDRGILTL